MAVLGRPKSDLRDRLIEAAWRIFTTRGYQATTVAAVIDSLGVSKGSYYHYFSSKEELFEAVVEKLALSVMDQIQVIAAEPKVKAIDKYNKIIRLSRSQQLDNIGLADVAALMINRPENALIKSKIQTRSKSLMGPVLEQIIAQGQEEGVFDPLPGEPMVGLLLEISALASQKSIAILETDLGLVEAAEGLRQNINYHLEVMELILGARVSSLSRIDPARSREMVRAYRGRRAAGEA